MIDEIITNIVIVLLSLKHSEPPSRVRGGGIYCVSFRVIGDSGEQIRLWDVESIGHRDKEVPTTMRMAAEIDLLEYTNTEAL